MKHYLPVFLWFLCQWSHAQGYLLDMRKQTISVPNRQFYIGRVIDARLSKDNIGSVQTGLTNARKTAAFRQELSTEFSQFFERNLPAGAGMRPVILKVLQLRIWERTDAFSEKAHAQLQCQFIHQTDTGEYLLLHQGSASLSKGGMDVTTRHGNNLAAVLTQCLNEFAAQNFGQLLARASKITAGQLEAPAKADEEPMGFAILKDTVLASGVYGSFAEFRSNSPSIQGLIKIESRVRTNENWRGTNEVHPYLIDADGKRQSIRKAWGIAYQGQAYILFNGQYYPLERTGNLFGFDAHVPTGYTPTVVAGGLVGGLIGGAIAGVIAAGTTADSKAGFVLELPTGYVHDVNAYPSATALVAKIVFYWRIDGKKTSAPAKVSLHNQTDTLTAELSAGSIAEFTWDNLGSDIFACVEGEPHACFLLVPQTKKTNFIEYVPAEGKSARVGLQPAIEKEAEFYVKQIRYRQENEAKRSKK